MTVPILQLDGLRAGYGHVQVLHEVTLSVPEGSTVAIVGPHSRGRHRAPPRAEHRIDEPCPDRIDPAAAIGDDDSEQGTDDQADRDGRDAHGEREACAIHDAAQDVSPE